MHAFDLPQRESNVKIILSRKGFDSGSGGCASPVLPDGRMLSLPIPDLRGGCRYGEIGDGTLGRIAEDLSGGRVRATSRAHLDPDLDPSARPRTTGWKGCLGQTGSASSHLASAGVGPGDVFLFFGWFRHVAQGNGGRWEFGSGDRGVHAIFGWLQVAEVLDLSLGSPAAWTRHPWLAGHPHLNRGAERGNTVFVASEELVLPGGRTGLSGYGVVPRLEKRNTLTSPGLSRSYWLLPDWFAPSDGSPALSYHSDPARWSSTPDGTVLRTVGRGQEFVLDCERRPQAAEWITSLLS